jgi:hypothetical protein
MEPIDSDLDYVVQKRSGPPANPDARFNWLLIIPTLGVLWLLYLIGAAAFQWPVTSVVDPVMSIMILVFFVSVALLFYAFYPRVKKS